MRDRDLSKELGDNGRGFVEEGYDWGKTVEKLEEALIQVGA